LSENTAVADGKSTIQLTACIPGEADEDKKRITFMSTTGTFDGESGNTKKADHLGISTMLLTVGTTPGTYTITSYVIAASDTFFARDTLRLLPVDPSEIITVSYDPEPGNWEADNTTIVKATITIDKLFLSARTIDILASDGITLADPDDTHIDLADPIGPVEVFLKLTDVPGICRLGITYGANPQMTDVQTSKPSYPDTMQIIIPEPAEQSIDRANGESGIAVYLFKNNASISKRLPILFEQYQMVNGIKKSVGSFNPPFAETGTASPLLVSFRTTADSSLVDPGLPIWVKASMQNTVTGGDLVDSLRLVVKP
jgi:hypothetical protein